MLSEASNLLVSGTLSNYYLPITTVLPTLAV